MFTPKHIRASSLIIFHTRLQRKSDNEWLYAIIEEYYNDAYKIKHEWAFMTAPELQNILGIYSEHFPKAITFSVLDRYPDSNITFDTEYKKLMYTFNKNKALSKYDFNTLRNACLKSIKKVKENPCYAMCQAWIEKKNGKWDISLQPILPIDIDGTRHYTAWKRYGNLFELVNTPKKEIVRKNCRLVGSHTQDWLTNEFKKDNNTTINDKVSEFYRNYNIQSGRVVDVTCEINTNDDETKYMKMNFDGDDVVIQFKSSLNELNNNDMNDSKLEVNTPDLESNENKSSVNTIEDKPKLDANNRSENITEPNEETKEDGCDSCNDDDDDESSDDFGSDSEFEEMSDDDTNEVDNEEYNFRIAKKYQAILESIPKNEFTNVESALKELLKGDPQGLRWASEYIVLTAFGKFIGVNILGILIDLFKFVKDILSFDEFVDEMPNDAFKAKILGANPHIKIEYKYFKQLLCNVYGRKFRPNDRKPQSIKNDINEILKDIMYIQ